MALPVSLGMFNFFSSLSGMLILSLSRTAALRLSGTVSLPLSLSLCLSVCLSVCLSLSSSLPGIEYKSRSEFQSLSGPSIPISRPQHSKLNPKPKPYTGPRSSLTAACLQQGRAEASSLLHLTVKPETLKP